MRYRIVMAKSAVELERYIEANMTNGWHPQGGVSVDNDWYHQAMVKYEVREDTMASLQVRGQGTQGRAGQAN